jgi:phospholipid/cholesterol/gamma-HCH transport system substrate-binding protein
VNGPTVASGRGSRLRRLTRAAAAAVAVVATAGVVAGCGFNGVYGMPLPGGADLGNHPYQVHVQFKDVLDLVPQAGVKVNDVPVGKVESVSLAQSGWIADVTVAVNGDVHLPANSVALLRQSSLLGEKYVELAAPTNVTPQGKLANGSTIPVDRTNRNPEVEEVLGALSLLLNGGGIGQLQDITRELNQATSGNEAQIRGLLGNLNSLVAGLDARRGDITRALDGLNRLSGTLNAQRDQIGTALDTLPAGVKVLADQRQQLVTMLQSLDKLSGVATDTIDKSRVDMVADLKALAPTLNQLAAAGQSLPNALQLLLTYPFPDSAVDGMKGDYANLFAKLDLNFGDTVDNLARSRQPLINLPTNTPPLPLPSSGSGGNPPSNGSGGLLGGLLGNGGH